MMQTYTDFSSSNIAELGYDEKKAEVLVKFKRKTGEITAEWIYWPVQPEEFDLIHHAISVGIAVNQYLVRSGQYNSRKIS